MKHFKPRPTDTILTLLLCHHLVQISECFSPATTSNYKKQSIVESPFSITTNNPKSLLYHHPSDTYFFNEPTISQNEKIPLDIIYENKLYQIETLKGETILAALERARASPDPKIRIPLPSIPHDCRRGNCLTCSGRLRCKTGITDNNQQEEANVNVITNVASSSFTSPAAFAASAATSTAVTSTYDSIKRGEDGLNPYMSREIEMAGFLLLCSSYVVGEGVTIEIGVKEEAWELAYHGKIAGEEAQLMGVEVSIFILFLFFSVW